MEPGRHGGADAFELGRMNAVGIFLDDAPAGYSVNILSTSRRRDRIVVVFEERMPPEIMMAQRPAPRLSPAARASRAAPAPPRRRPSAPACSARPIGQPTSPWAIVLIHRADLPISVEQRLFRQEFPLATAPAVPRHALFAAIF